MAKKKSALPELEWFAARANVLVDEAEDRNEMFSGIDDMIHQKWEKPEQFELDWIHPQASPEFALADEAASRILSDPDPRISVTPYSADKSDRDTADEQEKALKWMLWKASRRRAATIVEDITKSAHRYASVACEIIFLPEELKNMEAAGTEDMRLKAAMRSGPFTTIFHHPSTVFPRYSPYGLEEVLLKEEQDPQQVVDTYGNKAQSIKDAMAAKRFGKDSRCYFYKYENWDHIAIWVEMKSGSGSKVSSVGGEKFEITREKRKYPFISWVCKKGGTTLESEDVFSYDPLLGNAYHNDQFDLMNKVRTLRVSEVLRYAAAPRKWFQSDSRKQPESDASDPDLTLHLYDDEKIGELAPYTPDPALSQLHDELRNELEKSSVSSILLGSGNIPSNAALGTVNLITHSALTVVKKPRRLAEDSLSEVLEKMLLWIHYTGETVQVYGRNKEGQGEMYSIDPKQIDPDNIYISVELTADLPTDRQARMVTANAGIQSGLLSRFTAREDIGLVDGKEEEERIIEERYFDAVMESDIQNLMFTRSQQVQQQMMQQAQQMVMQQMQQQQMAQQGAPQGGPQPPPQNGLQQRGAPPPNPQMGVRGIEGAPGIPGGLTDPAAGGQIPQEMDPNATRELQTGVTQGGQELAEV